ncbi:MAG: hypothetical protein Q7R57_02225 [Dehalococcoidales bacterium]|nr:hypothetical protein [Dehalococcoidales bacterium]
MKTKAEVETKLASIKPKLKPQSNVNEFVRGLSSDGDKSLRPLTANETPRARGRAEGWFDALSWVLEE